MRCFYARREHARSLREGLRCENEQRIGLRLRALLPHKLLSYGQVGGEGCVIVKKSVEISNPFGEQTNKMYTSPFIYKLSSYLQNLYISLWKELLSMYCSIYVFRKIYFTPLYIHFHMCYCQSSSCSVLSSTQSPSF